MNEKVKICLICPNSPFLLDSRVFPFLGILKIASAWRERGAEVDFLDLSSVENWTDVIDKYFENCGELSFVGLTATTPQMPLAFDIASYIRKAWPKTKLVLGGSHATLMHTAAKKGSDRAKPEIEKIQEVFDVLVCGDGELTLDPILKLEKGVIDVDDKKSPYFLSNAEFSELPMPARDLIDMKTYQYSIDGESATSLIAQLGCPYRCSFCSGRSSPYLRLIRNRSTQSVIEELEFLHKTYGYKAFNFFDDELNVNKNMVELLDAISDLQEKLGVDFKLRGFTKSELFTEDQAKAMYRAGFRMLLTGFESGDPRILETIDKNATVEDNTRCVEIAKKYGLKVKALMSIGHAGESKNSINNTKQWLLKVNPDDFDCTVITTYPGSPYFDKAIKGEDDTWIYTSPKNGDKLYQKALDYTKDANFYKGIPGEYVSFVWTDFLNSKELIEERDNLENEVRTKLGIPFNPVGSMKKYSHEQSMGSANNILPDWILRTGKPEKKKFDGRLKVVL